LPRCLDLPAWPAMELRVASTLASFGGWVSSVSGFPVSSLLQLRLRLRFRVAPLPRSSGLPTVSLRVSPNSLLPAQPRVSLQVAPAADLLACLGTGLRVSPNSCSLGCAVGWISGSRPGFRILQRTAFASSVRTESCVCGWADVDSPAQLELCILGARRG